MRHTLSVLTVLALLASAPLRAGDCEDQFSSAGSVFSGTDFASRVHVPQVSVAEALGQMRGILIAEGMDVITEDSASGTLLAEQRATGTTRAIPVLVNVSGGNGAATVMMTVKTEKGQVALAKTMRPYVCGLLARLQGGEAGRRAAAAAAATQNRAATTYRDVYVFSREIAAEARDNALAVTARHQGRRYGLTGRIDAVQQDGDNVNVSFDVPDQRDVRFAAPGDHEARVGVACLFRPQHLAQVLTFRRGDRARFTGTFLRYDDLRRMVWLERCEQDAP